MTETEEKLWLENIRLRQQAHFYESLHARALVKQQEQADQIEVLKAKLAELQKRLFGRKAERGFSSEAWAAKRRLHRCRGQQHGARGHGRQCRSTMPVEEVVVEAPLAERICPRCGLPFEAAGTQAAHEEIQWEVRLVRKAYRRQCYRRTCACQGVPARVVAVAPARLIPKGLLSLSTIVEMLRLKYKYQLPLQRILGLAQDYGLTLSAGTVCGIWQKLVPLFAPLYLAIIEATRQSGQWLMDETRWEVFVSVEGKASHRWWVWVVASPISRVYLLKASRGAKVPEEFFGWDEETQRCRFSGHLMVDRFASYKFLVLEHPEIPLDNNGAERAGRPAAVGRKNYYGSGSVWSGQLMAMLMTLFQTLALHEVDDRGYLTAYLMACAQNQGQAPKDLTPWLPWNFEAAPPVPPAPTARSP